MKTALDEWVEFTRAWVDEQMRQQRDRDEAAFAKFLERLLPAD
ncbi:hypothetical protein LMG22037_05492 [Paraburkholderia phenoliruptrix]|uniref:Uncharacterized protein n=1 Tax=Paraburkholderia phenoliruptrix TaxID=252970 RepID=A0A6J5CAQ3_9BURK|nr:hypothetical protein [Paraburkholderia phenoliruptrix]CAB3729963.1 hypothetical protein LMG22037_05492 [Paraburkholderia phenoliruptrix]